MDPEPRPPGSAGAKKGIKFLLEEHAVRVGRNKQPLPRGRPRAKPAAGGAGAAAEARAGCGSRPPRGPACTWLVLILITGCGALTPRSLCKHARCPFTPLPCGSDGKDWLQCEETRVLSLGSEDLLETRRNPLQCACSQNPRDREACGLQPLGSQSGHDWSDLTVSLFTFTPT